MFLKIGDRFYNHVNIAIYVAKDKKKRKKLRYLPFRKRIWYKVNPQINNKKKMIPPKYSQIFQQIYT